MLTHIDLVWRLSDDVTEQGTEAMRVRDGLSALSGGLAEVIC